MSYLLKAGYNKVITKIEEKEEISKGGLILIEGGSGNMSTAVVIAAPANDEVGVSDKVIFDKSKSLEITVNDIKYNVIDIRDILAILKKVATVKVSDATENTADQPPHPSESEDLPNPPSKEQ